MIHDSDECLKKSKDWENYKCSEAKGYCNSWEKDVRRCCPTTCENLIPFDNVKCEASDAKGVCTYPNEAQCPSSGKQYLQCQPRII